MHTTLELDSSVPAFLAKLWKMVEDPTTDPLICWSPSGRSFFIRNQAKFTSDLLPHYYKHSNMASFIRQLNMYGFHKKVSVELGGLKCDRDEIEFAHQYFLKDEPDLVKHIKRKVATNKSQDSTHPSLTSDVMSRILNEVKDMKGRHDHMDHTLNEIKQENAALWREIVMLRHKHLKQQQIINKLIQFLVTLVQPSRSGLPVKRRYPLMINDSVRPHKQGKLSKPQKSPTGPVIHELDASEPDVDSDNTVFQTVANEIPSVQSPQEHIETQTDDENMETIFSIDGSVQISKTEEETRKKRVCKGKKKRKNKVPIKILVPTLENRKKPREELHMVEVSTDEDEPVILLKNKSNGSKPIPMSTVRSSKLAAMAANIKSQNVDTQDDLDTSADLEDNIEALDNDTSMMKLEDILIVPDMLNNSNIKNFVDNEEDNDSLNKKNTKLNQMDDERSVLMTNNNKQYDENKIKLQEDTNNRYDNASASSSKDLLVSCVNPSGKTDANYRLEQTEELGNHLDSMQAGLDNIHDLLRSDSCNIDANTLLGLFNDDSMTFGLSMNSELNPELNCMQEDDDHIISDSVNGGELMAYNPPSSNLLDFDDDIFLTNPSAPMSNLSDGQINNLYTTDSLDDSKVSLLDALVYVYTD
ncbi:heat shock factor protein isoform X3 [Monomorium pharaonis]|uniref:heat shock factor protein isoform X3 n=1 Tax=Monomorium pharaonis TaxID=307658 RepID=UPI00102E11F3|nr:heat shock factor protein isoform X3 [Monomorium pharaonis]